MVSKTVLKMLKRKRLLHPLWLKVPNLSFSSFLLLFFNSKNPPYRMCFGPFKDLSAFYGALLLFYLILQYYRIYNPFLAQFNNYFQMKTFFLWGDEPYINLINKTCQCEGKPWDSAVQSEDTILLPVRGHRGQSGDVHKDSGAVIWRSTCLILFKS